MAELPHITVAAVVEREGRFLMVRERADGAEVYNQPAGHVEPGESLLDAVHRETLEETTWRIRLLAFLGIYHYTSEANGISYVRHCFVAEAEVMDPACELDRDIIAAEWLTPTELRSAARQLRSPIVLQAIDDYLLGHRYPLELIRT